MKKNNFTIRLFFAIGILLITILAILGGFMLLKNFKTKAFVLNASVENINKEIENSIKSKNIFLENKQKIDSLNSHIVSGENDIPVVVEEIENIANDLGLPLTVNSIDFSDDKLLSIQISSYGEFNALFKMIKLFENSRFIFSINDYTLRQVYLLPPNNVGGAPVLRPVSANDQDSSARKIWSLNIKLNMNIKK